MINSVSGAASMTSGAVQRSNAAPSLSTEQRQLIEETLSNFDPEQLSASDAQSIVETFSSAGIQPGREMEKLMASLGFDAKAVGDLAGVEEGKRGGNPPPPPPSTSQGLEITDDMLQSLNELLNSYYSGDLSADEQATTLSAIKDIFAQTAPEGGLVRTTA
ncbi:hypothetical protein [Atopomonas sediminilitoris]|uniref:hypothetical protein n=1 Tax=Atopomonas sediminilitoris TaxID=2919919 RepID=UPI001F4D63B3|nr:hypothetical protein [Atopomonas sediminilitoris]MCJ8170598.1 hypothetical protein [Atopomonas sediminilitoris]